MREKEIEKRLIEEVKKLNGLCLKLNSQSANGIPDRLVLLPGRKVYFVEMKSPGEGLRPLQYYWMGTLNNLGFSFHKIDSLKDIDKFIKLVGGDPLHD